ncbi:MAG TPA: SDR family NAD(P)-dependent oxidoreductase, partial [Gemmata sp.]|nr:SDR family NAD(P)-dependent oxidoreductase [Gemmata sp.]
TFDLAKFGPDTGKPKHPATAWVVNGVRSRPINGPEPRLLGQAWSEGDKAARLASNAAAARSAPAVAPKPAVNGTATAPQPTAASKPPTLPTVAPAPQRAKMNTADAHPIAPAPSANGPVARADAAAPPDGAAAVVLRFQEVMARFLDTQRSVMLSYLGAGGGAAPAPAAYPAAASPNGYYPPAIPVAPVPAVTNRITRAEPVARPVPTPAAPPPAAAPAVPAAVVKPEPASTPVATPAAVAVPDAKPAAGPLDRETLLARLLDLVSDRTGYPKEALSIDLDLEADLGVDSIKRVEILGALAETLETGADGQQPNLEMEKLSVIKTLRGIADYVSEALGSTEPAAAALPPATDGPSAKSLPAAARNGDLHPGAREGDVQRLVVRLLDSPLPIRPSFTPPAGAILITDDRRGSARELADRLADLDIKTALVRMEDGETVPEGTFAADLTDPAAVTDLVALVREKCGPVSGLIHLLPLAEPPAGETPEARAKREVKSLYLLARGLESDVRDSGKNGSAVLLAVTGMGGTMGFGKLPAEFSAGHGGVAGFTKSLGHEWPEVTVRVVDVDPETPATHLAEMLLGELGDRSGAFEVGRNGDRRVTWQVEPGPLTKDAAAVELGPDSTVLITGGARGITAKIAEELARRYKPRLVLVGSSPEPVAEHPDTTPLTTAAELKAALMKLLPDAKPAAVEAAYKRLLKDREIRANLEAIRVAGSRVEYRSVDVRDAAAFGALIDELNAAGGIAGVIHGAGVIEDKLLRDKTPESFDRVFGTKVESAMTLARKLDPAKLKFLSLFASITSRYGNRGQSDYAAANEVLSKLACDLDRKWPGRVVSVAWGPWAEVGMVADLEKHLVARGLKLIEPSVGAGFAVDEVVFGAKGEPEVLVAGGTETPAARATPKAPGADAPVPTGPGGYPIAAGAGG